MFKKVVFALGALLVIFAIGLAVGIFAPRWLPLANGRMWNTATILTQVQNLRQLVTVKYVLEKVVVFDDAKWYGDSRVLLVAHGVAKAGIDLAAMKPGDIQISGKTIRVKMPPARITDVYLDDRRTEVLERDTGILRTFDKDLEQNARAQAVQELRLAAGQSGILNDAAEQAKAQLTSLLYQLGFTEVDIRVK